MDLLRILSDQRDELNQEDTSKLISRPEESQLDLNSHFAQVVIGVRRCGKSTLCRKVLIESKINFGYINFDDERLSTIKAADFDDLLSTLYRLNGDITHIFLDEIQNIDSWELFVNRMLRQGLKVVLTGSNANLLSGELATHLTGRYNEIELFPFSFGEVCAFKKLSSESSSTKDIALLKRELDTYLFKGGFPEVVEGVAPRNYGYNLLSTIVRKDIVARYRIRYSTAIWRLSNYLLENIGHKTERTGLAEKLGVGSYHTIEKYISYLENAYLILPLKRFSTKILERKQKSKSYAVDMAFVSDHDDMLQGENLGWRLENVIAIDLFRRLKLHATSELFYLQKTREYDIDFALTRNSRVECLIQVTYDFKNPSVKLFNREIGNLVKGAKATGCDNLVLIIMEGEEKIIEIDGFKIKMMSAVSWLLRKGVF